MINGIFNASNVDFINIPINDSVILIIMIGANPPTPYFLFFINKNCAILAPAINSKIATKILIILRSIYFKPRA